MNQKGASQIARCVGRKRGHRWKRWDAGRGACSLPGPRQLRPWASPRGSQRPEGRAALTSEQHTPPWPSPGPRVAGDKPARHLPSSSGEAGGQQRRSHASFREGRRDGGRRPCLPPGGPPGCGARMDLRDARPSCWRAPCSLSTAAGRTSQKQ